MLQQTEQQAKLFEHVSARTMVVLAFSATAGVMVEYYDFFIYGYAAASAFPSVFFPRLSPTVALVFSYLTFGAGFPARILGAFIFGHYGDRTGRKFAFLINIMIVGATTCLVGVLPGYASIGIAAPLLLLLLRVIQGIGLGGEFGGASSLLAEFGAQRKNRAFWMSLANLGIPLGAMSASAVMFTLSKSFRTGGWRVAMLLSLVIVLPALLARYKLADYSLVRAAQAERAARQDAELRGLQEALPRHLPARPGIGLPADGRLRERHLHHHLPSPGGHLVGHHRRDHHDPAASATFSASPSPGPWPIWLKRRQVAFIAIAATFLISYPLVQAILARNIAMCILTQFMITFFGIGILHGLAPILTSESFPTKFRYSGTGISYSISAVMGGMIAPPLLAGLIGQDALHNWYWVIIVYGIYAVIAMVALVFIRETRDLDLEKLDQDGIVAQGAGGKA